MISRKELQYVSTHTKDVPFPGINYAAEVMENLHAAFKAYEQKYQDKSYNFILSNGEEFTFEILAKNIAHLLGINYKGILSDYMEPVRSNHPVVLSHRHHLPDAAHPRKRPHLFTVIPAHKR